MIRFLIHDLDPIFSDLIEIVMILSKLKNLLTDHL